MATTKKCSSCNELKSTTKFSKYKKSKDGLQPHCKECQFVRTRQLTNAGTTGSIYKITNPDGFSYVGKTFKKLKYRFSEHISSFKRQSKKGISTFPKLHKSFTQWGTDVHIFELVGEYKNISREDLRQLETNLIQSYKKINKSLNTNN